MGPEEQSVQSTAKSGMGKAPLIVGGVVALGVLAWVVMGGIGERVTGVDVDRHADGSSTYTDKQGNTVTMGGNKLPDSWPSDAPTYPRASIQYSGTTNPQTGKVGSAVVFTTSDPVADVIAFYKTEFAAKGWTVEQTATAGAATIIAAKKDTRTMGLQILSTTEGQTSVTIGITLE